MKVTVLGAGAWGTALARLLQLNENQVTLWGHHPDHLREIQVSGVNQRYLPGIEIPAAIQLRADIQSAIGDSDGIVVAVPSRAFREITGSLARYTGTVVSVTKGIESDTGLTMSGILKQTAPHARVVALSGPTLAMEVARSMPTAAVAASPDLPSAYTVQQLFHRPTFRVYTSTDLLGVELGGALKNVIAIGAGVCDGLGFGDNSKAALITRAIVEIQRLGVACGAQAETFAGLSGLGDLTVTCISRLSRNRTFGERLGQGEKPADILASTVTVAEGYPTTRSAYQLARKLNVTTPIIDQVYAMLYENKDIKQAVKDLIERETKPEVQ